MEFQAVILAGGEGFRLQPLSRTTPKALLPIGQHPMLYYPLTYLENHGFRNVFIVYNKKASKEVGKYIVEFMQKENRQLSIHSVVIEDELDTADALRIVGERITSDFIVLGCDVVTNVRLNDVLELYRKEDCSSVVVLKKHEQSMKKKKTKAKGGLGQGATALSQEMIGINKNGGEISFFQMVSTGEKSFTIGNSYLRHWRRMELERNLEDVNFYIFRQWVIDLLQKRKKIHNIKHELIPFLVKAQIPTGGGVNRARGSYKENIQSLAFQMSSKEHTNPIRVFPFIFQEDRKRQKLLKIVRNLEVFKTVNLEIPQIRFYRDNQGTSSSVNNPSDKTKKIQVGNQCAIGQGCLFEGSNTLVKRSNLGKNVKVASNVKIVNSVIFDHVQIQDNVEIFNSIICSSCTIRKNSKIMNCIVEDEVLVDKGTVLKDETVSKQNYLLSLDLDD